MPGTAIAPAIAIIRVNRCTVAGLTFNASATAATTVNVPFLPYELPALTLNMGASEGNMVNVGDATHDAAAFEGNVTITGTTALTVNDTAVETNKTVTIANTDLSYGITPDFSYATATLLSLTYNASTTNLGKSFSSGIDFDVTGRVNTPIGRLTSNVRATYMLNDKQQLLAGGEYFSTIADNHPSIGDVTFRWKGQWTNTLQTGNWAHAANINFQSGYKDFPTEVENLANGETEVVRLKVKPYVTLDWQTAYTWNKQLTLSLGIKNVFDKEPPLSLRVKGGHMLGFDYRYYSPIGRTFQARASYDF